VSPSQSDLRVAHSGLEGVGPRSGTGYRRYGDEDLGRLQRIMFYRELGFALEDITDLVNDPGADSAEHLRRQHRCWRHGLGGRSHGHSRGRPAA
jgi:DNA-binding transcriptional MerR regulator